MSRARVELYKDGDHMAVVTNADQEHEFWQAFCELLGKLITEDIFDSVPLPDAGPDEREAPHFGGDWEFQLSYWLPAATDIVCRLRGYKNTVREERTLIAGEVSLAGQHKVAEINTPAEQAWVPPPEPVAEAVA